MSQHIASAPARQAATNLPTGNGSASFRLAIVGAGLITRNTHLPTALSLPGIEVIAVVDPAPGRALELITEYALRADALTDVDKLVGRADGAIIATPNHTHRALAEPLLRAGVSTLIEKPLATSVDDSRAIVAAAKTGNAQVAIAHYQRFLDAPRFLKRLLARGEFGRVRSFCHQFGTSGGWPAMSAYTLKREQVGGGVLVVSGTHFLDRMLDVWGMPHEAQLWDDASDGPEAHCEAHIGYRSAGGESFQGVLRYSKCVALPGGLTIDTDAGTVLLRDGFNDPVTLIPRSATDLRHEIVTPVDASFPGELRDPSQRMLWDFVSAVRDGRPPEVDGEQGCRSMELVRWLYRSRQPLVTTWTGGQA